MIEDWKPEMDLSPKKIHMNLCKFKKWMNEKYEASKIYGEPDEICVWEDVIDKFEELFK